MSKEKLEQTVDDVENDSAVVVEEKDEVKVEEQLEKTTAERLEKTFVTGEKLEQPAEPSEKSDDSTPDKEKPAEEADDKDGPTPAEKLEEAKLEAEEKGSVDKDDDSKAQDEDADKSKAEQKDIPPLSDAYYRAAIHRGWSEQDINEQYKANPELTIKTLGNIYEGLNKSSKEFAAFGRAHKESLNKPADIHVPAKEAPAKAIDVEKLRKEYENDPIVDLVVSFQEQNELLSTEIEALKSTRTPNELDGFSQEEQRSIKASADVVTQQIDTFFNSDELKGYGDFYGAPESNSYDDLTPGQKMNRWGVIEMMDQMITGADALGQDMKVERALRLAHLSVTEPIREKVIREEIKSKVTQRSKAINLQPVSAPQPESGKPKTTADLEVATTERLNKVFGN